MIEIQLKNLEDFKRVVEGQKTVYFRKNLEGFIYYVVSNHGGLAVINMYRSEYPLKFNREFNPDESDGINVGSLIEVEKISLFHGGGSS